jgi:hypothetical protein
MRRAHEAGTNAWHIVAKIDLTPFAPSKQESYSRAYHNMHSTASKDITDINYLQMFNRAEAQCIPVCTHPVQSQAHS